MAKCTLTCKSDRLSLHCMVGRMLQNSRTKISITFKDTNHIQQLISHSTLLITTTFKGRFHNQETKSHSTKYFTFKKQKSYSTITITFKDFFSVYNFFSVNNFFFWQQFFLSTTFFDVNNFFLLSTSPMMLLGKQRLSTGRPSQKSSPSLSKWRRPKAQSSIRSNSTWTALMTP